MKRWIIVEEQFIAHTRSLFIVLGLLDSNGELACPATFLCCEAPLPMEPSNPNSPLPEQPYVN